MLDGDPIGAETSAYRASRERDWDLCLCRACSPYSWRAVMHAGGVPSMPNRDRASTAASPARPERGSACPSSSPPRTRHSAGPPRRAAAPRPRSDACADDVERTRLAPAHLACRWRGRSGSSRSRPVDEPHADRRPRSWSTLSVALRDPSFRSRSTVARGMALAAGVLEVLELPRGSESRPRRSKLRWTRSHRRGSRGGRRACPESTTPRGSSQVVRLRRDPPSSGPWTADAPR